MPSRGWGYCYGLGPALPTGVAYLRCHLLAALLLISILDICLKPVSTTGPEHLNIDQGLQIQVGSAFKIIPQSLDVTKGVTGTVEAGQNEEIDRSEGS